MPAATHTAPRSDRPLPPKPLRALVEIPQLRSDSAPASTTCAHAGEVKPVSAQSVDAVHM